MIRFTFVFFTATCVFGFPANLKFKGHGEKIVGGLIAKPGQFPYQAEMSLNERKQHHCGGTILNERWILTAAHCVQEFEPEDFTIKLGSTTLSSNNTPYSISKIIPHPSHNPATKQNDIALLYTTTVIIFSLFVQPITISPSPPVGSDVIASGWGYLKFESDSPIPDELHYVALKTIANQDCERMMMGVGTLEVTNANLCTLTKSGEGVCGGDSGGPLTWEGKLVGIVSWGVPCGAGYPDVFVNLGVFSKWINENIQL